MITLIYFVNGPICYRESSLQEFLAVSPLLSLSVYRLLNMNNTLSMLGSKRKRRQKRAQDSFL